MKKIPLMLLSAVFALSTSAWAAPLNQAHVPAGAKWVLHADFDTFSDSEMWRLVNQEINDKIQQKINAITTLLGSDPTEDI